MTKMAGHARPTPALFARGNRFLPDSVRRLLRQASAPALCGRCKEHAAGKNGLCEECTKTRLAAWESWGKGGKKSPHGKTS